MVDSLDDKYRQQVMLTCKLLLDSIHEGGHVELADLMNQRANKIRFAANIIELGDTFRSDGTLPVYGLLFTVEGEDYLVRKAHAMGLTKNAKAIITIQPVEEKDYHD